MATITAKVKERLVAGLKRYQPILASARSRDVNESDTVTIVTDMLQDIFGFDKFLEITSEYAIRGTYVDLAIKRDGKLDTLIECKAIGLDLKDNHVKQAVDYAANQGVEWVFLTNGVIWQVYRVQFTKPIVSELVIELDLTQVNPKNTDHIERVYMLTKEGLGKAALGDYYTQRQILNRYCIGAVAMSDPVIDVIRKELRRMAPDVKVDSEHIREVLVQEVLKRDVVEGEKADDARKKVNKAASKQLKKIAKEKVIGMDGGSGKERSVEGAAVAGE